MLKSKTTARKRNVSKRKRNPFAGPLTITHEGADLVIRHHNPKKHPAKKRPAKKNPERIGKDDATLWAWRTEAHHAPFRKRIGALDRAHAAARTPSEKARIFDMLQDTLARSDKRHGLGKLPGHIGGVHKMNPKPLSKKALDKLIEQLYYKNASGLQINIMDIGKVFKAGEKAYAAGQDVEQAVKDAIKVYCVKSNPKGKKRTAKPRKRNPSYHVGDIVTVQFSAYKAAPDGPTFPGWQNNYKVIEIDPDRERSLKVKSTTNKHGPKGGVSWVYPAQVVRVVRRARKA